MASARKTGPRRVNVRDQLSGVFWFALSIFVCVEAAGTDIGTFHSPGPGFLPFWAGVFFAILSIILVVASIVERSGGVPAGDLWKGRDWRKGLIVISSLVVYAFVLQTVGYLIATFGLMMLLFGLMRRMSWWVRALTALVTVLATHLIFHVWLEVQLPKGILEHF